MMKIEVYGKELKEVIEKALAVIPKKTKVSALDKIFIDASEDGVKFISTDLEHYLEVEVKANVIESGKILLDSADVKLLLKITDYITITELDNGKVDIKTEKKNLSMINYDIGEYPELPKLKNETEVLNITENYLLDAITNLYTFTSTNENNPMMQVYNFNLKDRRIEALDGHRIGIKSLESQDVMDDSNEIHLHNMAYNVFKKLLSKKSENKIAICRSEKYTIVKGSGFKYIQRNVDGLYFKVSNMLSSEYDHKMIVDCKELLEVSKYNCELLKSGVNDKMPMNIYSNGNNIYTYFNNGKIESVDHIKTSLNEVKKDFTIAFNPIFIKDVMSIIDSETSLCTMANPKAPLFIHGKEYSFLILPVNITTNQIDKMKEYLNKIEVAA